MLPTNWVKHTLAELVGTFIFFSIGMGAIFAAQVNKSEAGAGLLAVAVAHGVILAIMVSAFGRISVASSIRLSRSAS